MYAMSINENTKLAISVNISFCTLVLVSWTYLH